MQNILIVVLSDNMSTISIKKLMHAIEFWRDVERVEFKDHIAQLEQAKSNETHE